MGEFWAAASAFDAFLQNVATVKESNVEADEHQAETEGMKSEHQPEADEIQSEKVYKPPTVEVHRNQKLFGERPLDLEFYGVDVADADEIVVDDSPTEPSADEAPSAATSPKQHPWAVRPTHRGRSTDLSEAERASLQQERSLAEQCGMTWQERGPDGPDRPNCWRGQQLRQGKGGGKVRYANRGGKFKHVYQQLARDGKLAKKGVGKGGKKEHSAGRGSSSSAGPGKAG